MHRDSRKLARLEALHEQHRCSAGEVPAEGIPRAARPVRASFAQERLWFLDRLYPGGSAYNVPFALRVGGEPQAADLEWAVRALVRRHESLRTTFQELDGTPMQIVAPDSDVHLAVERMGDAESLRQRVEHEAGRPFDLTSGPLVRLYLFHAHDIGYVLLVVAHHIIADGWSMEVLLHDLSRLYAAAPSRSPGLPELQVQYGDYAAWQRERLLAGEGTALLTYWKKRLAGIEPLQLPVFGRRAQERTYVAAKHGFVIDEALAAAVRSLSRREGASLFMTSVAAFGALLHRYTNQDDFAVGTLVWGRDRREFEDLIGMFVNTLALRMDVSGDRPFRELLAEVRHTALDAYAHQALPFEALVHELQPDRSLSRSPLIEAILAFRNAPRHVRRLGLLELLPYPLTDRSAKFDLKLNLSDTGRELRGEFVYSAQLFTEPFVRSMADAYRALLCHVANNPGQPHGDFPLLGKAERRRVLVDWNESRREYSGAECLHDLFKEQADSTPDAVAVICGDECLTYAELSRRVAELATVLRTAGVGPEVPVGIHLPRGLNTVIGVLATLAAGGAYIPLDCTLPRQRLETILADARPPVVLTEYARAASLGPHPGRHVLALDRPLPNFGDRAAATTSVAVTPENSAYIIYTSGSTGTPKGVIVEHRQIVNYVRGVSDRTGFRAGQNFALVQPLSVDSCLTVFFPSLCRGGCLYVFAEDVSTDPVMLGAAFEEAGIDSLKIAPSHLAALQSGDRPERFVPRSCLVLGGEASARDWAIRVHAMRPECALVNHYGPTETTVGVLTFTLGEWPAGDASPLVPLGQPLPNVRAYVLSERCVPAPVGVVGELYIGGSGVTRGYLNQPARTAERFVPDPFSGEIGARLYKTGDLARFREDGMLEYLGRRDDQVKIRGYRVELGEIEAALCQHAGVRQAGAAVRTPEDGVPRLVAYVVWHSPELRDLADLQHHVKSVLPQYMVPAAWVELDRLPQSPQGKLNRKALPVPEAMSDDASADWVGPRTVAEALLAEVWSDVLRVDRPGMIDNFFALGGDSILTMQVVARAARRGLRITPRQMFEHQTIAALAAVAVAPAVPIAPNTTGEVGLTPIQQWFFEQESNLLHHYNQSVLLEPSETLDPDTLRQAFDYLLAHHEALRFRFVREDGTWRCAVRSTAPAAVEHVDLSALPAEQHARAIDRGGADWQASLNLAEGPMLRAVLFNRGAACPQRLLIVAHHLVIDSVSWRILIDDLESVYRQIQQATPPYLPPVATSFQQWREYLQAYADSPEVQRERDCWTAEDSAAVEPFPEDGPGGSNTAGSSSRVVRSLSATETRALVRGMNGSGGDRATVHDALVTALAMTCCEWTGRSSCRLWLEGHGREPVHDGADLSRTVGWFTSLYPVRLELDDSTTSRDILERVRAHRHRIVHNGIGYGVLRYLSRDPEVRRRFECSAPPEITFNYLGHFDQTFGRMSLLRFVSEPHGPSQSPGLLRRRKIEVIGRILDGELRLAWTYSTHLHRRETIERLAARHLDIVREIAKTSPRVAGVWTPADVPAARIDERTLATLLGAIER